MRYPFLFAVLLCSFCSRAQNDSLYYFYNKDSTQIGVKSSLGKIIIPPIYQNAFKKPGEKISSREILLFEKGGALDSMGFSYNSKIFDREGHFLYSSFWFDNGPDYYVEGLRRFVENGKMGFADRNGKR